MPVHVRLELILIAILLPCVALFAFWYVPLSIDAPQGFGSDSEISPRFAPYLLAALMVAAMVGRLVQLGLAAMSGQLDALPDDLSESGSAEETRRGIMLNFVTTIYGFLLVPLLGFYAASFALVAYLVHRLGERRLIMVALIGAACILFTYLLFDELLSVRLPRGAISSLFKG
ncbi:tripartite tricarboxylate transporter TctB family protein [Puniceibacterium sp. IMCC21224]|uniref:tripartite tricarboxylate transporter TctB family protein n=1 Tax=Puniceibacterium sp. IMCC21224 TaxID=1618204 RepID=UPI00064D7DE5|nr:tripartite tricarboxylate transporter TctB family protein [Puniceibacterium sp. IMCC21224]KMK64876.1 Tripartite tricarboxylate transporter TctB family [Puniceibacterium sp. IMCC21224]